jgi:tetratricopeptide (TPR) repeat protein
LAGGTASSGATACEQALDSAITVFKQDDYNQALDIVNKAIVQCPDDAVMHEFRALVLFAKGDYQQAAATIHSVLAVGPGWNWSTLSSLYSSVPTYTNQLRALEAFTNANPQDSASRFLLGYHYMADGYPDSAERQFQNVVRLTPNDRVASDLLKMTTKPPAGDGSDASQQPTPQPPTAAPANLGTPNPALSDNGKPPEQNVPPIDAEKLIGTWHASRDDGSNFDLTLNKDLTFQWKFGQKTGAPQQFDGTYTVDGNVVALERKDGGSLIAGVVPAGDNKFNFKLIGSPPEDPGLNFAK